MAVNMGRGARRQRQIGRRLERRRVQAQRFTEPITGKQAQHISKAQANVAYRPTERTIQGQIRGSAVQGKNLGGWYNQFAQQLDQSRQATAAAYQQANQQLTGVLGQAGDAAAAVGSGLSQEAAQRQATTGIEGDPRIAAMRQAAGAQSSAFGAALQAPLIGQAANQYGFQTNQANYARREGLQQQIEERKRRAVKQGDLQALRKEKGQYRVEKLNELRKGERDYEVQRAATGIDRRQQSLAEKENRQNVGFKNRELAQEDKKINISAQEAQRLREEGHKNVNGMTPSELRDAKEGRRSAAAAVRSVVHSHGWPDNPHDVAELIAGVSKESEVSPAQAEAAVHRLLRQHRKERKKWEKTTRVPEGTHPNLEGEFGEG